MNSYGMVKLAKVNEMSSLKPGIQKWTLEDKKTSTTLSNGR